MKTPQSKSLTIVVPAYNEEVNLRPTILHILEAAKVLPDVYEIIIVDDYSSDQTPQVAQKLTEESAVIRYVRNELNLGFGGTYKRGVDHAKMTHTIMIPGDDAYPVIALKELFKRVGVADIVMSYTTNTHVRPLSRRMISRGFVIAMNFLFGLKLRYYNGVTVIPTHSARRLNPSDGFSYAAENLVRLIKLEGFTYEEVPAEITERKAGKSKALRLKNILTVIKGITVLIKDVYWSKIPVKNNKII